MRPLIVHYHLFKNAGTSVEAILQSNFGAGWVSFDSDDPAGFVPAQTVVDMAVADPDIRAFSSHQIRPPVPEAHGFTMIPLVFLRHPLDRMQSVYDFDRRRGPVTPAGEIAVANDFGPYVDIMLERNAIHVRNFHIRSLSDLRDPSTGRRRAADPEDFDRALAFVQSLPAIGVVERYRESWQGLAAVVRTWYPRFFVHHTHSNADPERPDSLDHRLDRMCERLGDDRFERLCSVNELDLMLYEAALARLDLTEPAGG